MNAGFPTPNRVDYRAKVAGSVDSHGNPTQSWQAPVQRAVMGWGAPLSRVAKTAGVQALVVELQLYVPPDWTSDEGDLIIVGGKTYKQVGEVEDWTHGPFGFAPGNVVNLVRSR